jgi:hypothetical protein
MSFLQLYKDYLEGGKHHCTVAEDEFDQFPCFHCDLANGDCLCGQPEQEGNKCPFCVVRDLNEMIKDILVNDGGVGREVAMFVNEVKSKGREHALYGNHIIDRASDSAALSRICLCMQLTQRLLKDAPLFLVYFLTENTHINTRWFNCIHKKYSG